MSLNVSFWIAQKYVLLFLPFYTKYYWEYVILFTLIMFENLGLIIAPMARMSNGSF